MEEEKGILYTVDDDDFVVSQTPCDYHEAIQSCFGQRDFRGNRYFIGLFGKPIPYKFKKKNTFDIIVRPQDTAASLID